MSFETTGSDLFKILEIMLAVPETRVGRKRSL